MGGHFIITQRIETVRLIHAWLQVVLAYYNLNSKLNFVVTGRILGGLVI